MSVFAVTAQSRAAAERCGADPEIWCAVHALHLARAQVAVETRTAQIGGAIVGVSDHGFTVGYGPEVPWADALAVVPLSRQEGR